MSEPQKTEVDSVEVAARLETATKRMEEANAQFEKNQAVMQAQKAELALAGQSEAGQEPAPPLTREEQIKKDVQDWMPNDFLPRSLKK